MSLVSISILLLLGIGCGQIFSDEPRLGLVAEFDGKIWTAIFTTRGDQTRIISVRRARQNEESIYDNSARI